MLLWLNAVCCLLICLPHAFFLHVVCCGASSLLEIIFFVHLCVCPSHYQLLHCLIWICHFAVCLVKAVCVGRICCSCILACYGVTNGCWSDHLDPTCDVMEWVYVKFPIKRSQAWLPAISYTHAHITRSPNSVIWYQRKGYVAVHLGRWL